LGKELIDSNGNIVEGTIPTFDGSYTCSGESTGDDGASVQTCTVTINYTNADFGGIGGNVMIKTELLSEGTLIKHYSDKGFMLLQNETGIKYLDPIDVVPCRYTYTETDELGENGDEEITGDEFLDMVKEVL
jgi:hypothetical protein